MRQSGTSRPHGTDFAAAATAQTRRWWDRRAAGYDRRVGWVERRLLDDGRAWVGVQASGEVLEVAVGTGRNLPFYPKGVRLTGVDLSPAMLQVARDRARRLGLTVELREGDAEALPFPDASFDTVVCTLSLCTIPDDRRAVAEMYRVLRPGGRLLLLDHVRSTNRLLVAVQWLVGRLSRRDHLLRRPLEHVHAQGFAVERRQRSKAGVIERLTAHKPAQQPGSDLPSVGRTHGVDQAGGGRPGTRKE
jgi:SAM-dependent methyltransferase